MNNPEKVNSSFFLAWNLRIIIQRRSKSKAVPFITWFTFIIYSNPFWSCIWNETEYVWLFSILIIWFLCISLFMKKNYYNSIRITPREKCRLMKKTKILLQKNVSNWTSHPMFLQKTSYKYMLKFLTNINCIWFLRESCNA